MDNLALIEYIIEDHSRIGNDIKSIGRLFTDQEAIYLLQKSHGEWIPGRPDNLLKELNKLIDTITSLKAGLKKHFAFEEKALAAMIGELLTKSLLSQHAGIMKKLDDVESTITNLTLNSMNRDEILEKEMGVQRELGILCEMIEDHARKEEVLLDMLKAGLR